MRLPYAGLALSLLLTAIIALPATGQDATPGGTPVAGTASFEIASQEAIGPDIGQALSLSPDGQWVAIVRSPSESTLDDAGEVCAYPVVTREAPTCVAYAGYPIASDSVAWSPDSTRFAFTEDLLRRLLESDIWVFDRTDATLTDLTDDGVQGNLLDVEASPPLDVAPVWSPDGEQIAFARSADPPSGASGTPGTVIHRISAEGGEPTEITVMSDQAVAVIAGLRWPTDDTIYYTVDELEPSPTDGLWSVAAAGGAAEQIVGTTAVGFDQATLVDLSVGGLALLKTIETSSDQLSPSGFATVDLATGDVEPVTLDVNGPVNPSGLDAGPVRPSVLAVAFSPDGGSLLVAGRLAGSPPMLILRDLETGVDVGLGELDIPVGTGDLSAGMFWGTNGFVLAPAGQDESLLLTLREAGSDA